MWGLSPLCPAYYGSHMPAALANQACTVYSQHPMIHNAFRCDFHSAQRAICALPQVNAKCKPPDQLVVAPTVFRPGTIGGAPACAATFSEADLISLIDGTADTVVGASTAATPAGARLDPQPGADGNYTLFAGAGGREYNFTLSYPNPTGQLGTASCTAVVTVAAPAPAPACKRALTLDAAAAGCFARVSPADLLKDPGGGANTGFGGTLTLDAVPLGNGTYSLPVGTSRVRLTASNCVGTSAACSSQVTVRPPAPPVAACKRGAQLPATAHCAAQVTAADLIKLIDAGSTAGGGAPPTLSVQLPASVPPPPPGGAYALPVGSYQVTLNASTCGGASSSCSTLVTVADQEALSPSRLSCGALPAGGVLEVRQQSDSGPPACIVTCFIPAAACSQPA